MALPIGALITGGSMLASMFGKKDKGTQLEDIRSPQQIAAQQALQQLGLTGSFGGINLGEQYGGQLGSYDTSGNQQAYSQLMDLYGGQGLSQANDLYSKLASEKFDPSDPSSGYADFSRALAKSGQESADVLNQEAAMTGGRFGTGIQKQKASLAADMQNQRGQYLANLWQGNQANRLAGAQGLQNITSQKAGLVGDMANQQAVVNAIKDQQAKDMLNEYKRQRSETLSRIDILGTEANRNPYMGVSSIPNASPFSGLVNSVMGSLGQGIGNQASSWIGGLFKGGAGNTSNASNLFKNNAATPYTGSLMSIGR